MDDPASSSLENVWRVTVVGRAVGLLVCVGWFALALGISLGGGVGTAIPIILWAAFVVVVFGAWRLAFVPYVALRDDAVEIQNRVLHRTVAYRDIEDVIAGYGGLTLRLKGGDVTTAWAVQKSNIARWTKNDRTRADSLVRAILARASDSRAAI